MQPFFQMMLLVVHSCSGAAHRARKARDWWCSGTKSRTLHQRIERALTRLPSSTINQQAKASTSPSTYLSLGGPQEYRRAIWLQMPVALPRSSMSNGCWVYSEMHNILPQ